MVRLIIKAVVYRLICFCVTGGIIVLFTKRVDVAVGVALVEAVVKTVVYLIYDKLWEQRSGC